MIFSPYLYEIFPSFLDISLREESNSEILHDELIFWSDIESSLEENNSLFDITHHRVGPTEISEDFWIVGRGNIGSLEK